MFGPRFSIATERAGGVLTLTVLAAVLTIGAVSCSADETDPDGSSVPVTTGVGGIGGARSTSEAVGVTSTASGDGGSGGSGSHGPSPIVLAHGFFGFEDFAGAGFESYFYGVKDDLAAHGETVFTPAVDPFNDSTFRGAQLIERIEEIRAETGADKVVIIGHSQGGLDARVVAHDRPDLVSAVITIATPHHGTPIADVALQLLADPNAAGVVNELVNLIGAPLYDQIGNETAVTKPLYLFSQPGITAFNAAYPDAPGVFYASIAGRSDMSLGGQDCAAQISLPFMTSPQNEQDPVDPLFWLLAGVAKGNDGHIINDGLVRAVDAKHGQFWGCIPADHLDEIGQLFGDGPGVGNDWDYKAFYRDLVTHIRELGY